MRVYVCGVLWLEWVWLTVYEFGVSEGFLEFDCLRSMYITLLGIILAITSFWISWKVYIC